ncbi:MAG: hypothetical protein OEV78_00240 [Spirochaetia bacterium]|nr:hypothetical protein [Spirochaetia bacterium]
MKYLANNQLFTKGDFWFFMISNLVFSVLSTIAAKWHMGYAMAYFIIGASLISYFIYVHFFGNSLLRKLFYFGITVGFVELFNDTWLIAVKKVLIYYPGGPFIIDTPLYMPFCWASILITFGYLAGYLNTKTSLSKTTLLLSISAAFYIPFFEKIADEALWWHYIDSPSIHGVPWFVIIGEFLLAIPIPFIIQKLENANSYWIFVLGTIEGFIVWLATWLAMVVMNLI